MKYHLLITAGDPSGIGTETILNFFNLEPITESFPAVTYVVIGHKEAFHFYAQKQQVKLEFEKNRERFYPQSSFDEYVLFFPNSLNQIGFIHVDWPLDDHFVGLINARSGMIAYQSLKISIEIIKNYGNELSPHGVVTGPVSKEAIVQVCPSFIDQTNLFAQAFRVTNYTMSFFSSLFNLLLLSIHVPIKRVPCLMTKKNFDRILQHALEIKEITADEKPILVLGLNPHAGENGLIGNEEKIIKTSLIQFKKKHPAVPIMGPISADTAFIRVADKKHRTVVACYHDQGLIPFKTLTYLNRVEGVNVTWGLPMVRTSVDHGTAFDISGQNLADWKPLRAAINKNIELFVLRQKNSPFDH